MRSQIPNFRHGFAGVCCTCRQTPPSPQLANLHTSVAREQLLNSVHILGRRLFDRLARLHDLHHERVVLDLVALRHGLPVLREDVLRARERVQQRLVRLVQPRRQRVRELAVRLRAACR